MPGGKNDTERVQKLIPASIQFGLIAGIFLGIIVFFASDIIAAKIFHDAALSFPLKIFALGIPFFTLINVFVSIFRGFDDVKPTIYFQHILRTLLFPLFLLPIIFLDLPFTDVFYAVLASLVISCAVLIVYAVKRLPSPINFRTRLSANPVAKELFRFSLPLLGVAMLSYITSVLYIISVPRNGVGLSIWRRLYFSGDRSQNFIHRFYYQQPLGA